MARCAAALIAALAAACILAAHGQTAPPAPSTNGDMAPSSGSDSAPPYSGSGGGEPHYSGSGDGDMHYSGSPSSGHPNSGSGEHDYSGSGEHDYSGSGDGSGSYTTPAPFSGHNGTALLSYCSNAYEDRTFMDEDDDGSYFDTCAAGAGYLSCISTGMAQLSSAEQSKANADSSYTAEKAQYALYCGGFAQCLTEWQDIPFNGPPSKLCAPGQVWLLCISKAVSSAPTAVMSREKNAISALAVDYQHYCANEPSNIKVTTTYNVDMSWHFPQATVSGLTSSVMSGVQSVIAQKLNVPVSRVVSAGPPTTAFNGGVNWKVSVIDFATKAQAQAAEVVSQGTSAFSFSGSQFAQASVLVSVGSSSEITERTDPGSGDHDFSGSGDSGSGSGDYSTTTPAPFTGQTASALASYCSTTFNNHTFTDDDDQGTSYYETCDNSWGYLGCFATGIAQLPSAEQSKANTNPGYLAAKAQYSLYCGGFAQCLAEYENVRAHVDGHHAKLCSAILGWLMCISKTITSSPADVVFREKAAITSVIGDFAGFCPSAASTVNITTTYSVDMSWHFPQATVQGLTSAVMADVQAVIAQKLSVPVSRIVSVGPPANAPNGGVNWKVAVIDFLSSSAAHAIGVLSNSTTFAFSGSQFAQASVMVTVGSNSEVSPSADPATTTASSGTTTAHSGTTTKAHSGTTTKAHSGTTTAHSGTTTKAHSGTTTKAHSGTTTKAHSGTTTKAQSGTTTPKPGNDKVTTTYSVDMQWHFPKASIQGFTGTVINEIRSAIANKLSVPVSRVVSAGPPTSAPNGGVNWEVSVIDYPTSSEAQAAETTTSTTTYSFSEPELAQASASSSVGSTTTGTDGPSTSSKTSSGMIAGAVVGGIVLVGAVIGVAFLTSKGGAGSNQYGRFAEEDGGDAEYGAPNDQMYASSYAALDESHDA